METVDKRPIELHVNHTRAHFPVGGTVILWLLLDRLQPIGWIQGMAWTLWVIVWLTCLFSVFRSKRWLKFHTKVVNGATTVLCEVEDA